MTRAFLLLLCGGLLAVAGCAGPRTATEARRDLPAGFPNHSATAIQRHLLEGTDSLQAFRAKASLTVNSPDQRGSFSAQISHRRDDSLYMTLSPGLGIEAARILVTPDSFYVYNRIEKQLTYGAVRDAQAVLPAALTVDDLFANLTGTLVPSLNREWNVEADSSYYHLTSGLRSYVVDPTTWRVVRYVKRSPSGEVVEERRFSEFDRFGSLYLPRRIIFRRPADDTNAVLYYRDLTLNPKRLQFDLRVSSSAERRPIP